MSSIQKSKNEDIDEAIAILEEETQRRIEDIQQRIEFMCASLRAQGNTEINKMLMSVRELTVEQFCETYDASTHIFLEQQKLKRTHSAQTDTTQDTLRKRRRSNSFSIAVDDDVPLNTTHVEAKPKSNAEIPPNEHITPKETAKSLRQSIANSEPINQEPQEPIILRLNRTAKPSIDIELNTQGAQEDFSVESAMDKLNQLSEQQKKFIKEQIKDLQDKLDIFQKSIV
ncbi:hypothetical protein MBANPS3_002198 [Mucor bainieri]